MSILSTSPTASRHLDMNIAAALGDVNAAIILQQLNYWMKKEGVGVIVDGIKYIYNTYRNWTSQQFKWLSERQFRKAMGLLRSLEIVEVIQHQSKKWNQTNYYSLNYDRLAEFLEREKLEIIETVELTARADRDDKTSQIEMTNSDTSLNESKIITKKRTAKQDYRDRQKQRSSPIAAASSKQALEGGENQKQSNPSTEQLTAVPSQIKRESEVKESNPNKETKVAKVDYIVNQKWRSLISVLDSTGIPINKTIKDLLKLYPSEKVEGAIAIVKSRKRDQYIPNLAGYFVSALKGDWASQNLTFEESGDGEVDKGAVFRHWYDLARELGYCSGQEIRDGEQFVRLSGVWEKWESAVERGYSLDYLKTIVKRNKGQ